MNLTTTNATLTTVDLEARGFSVVEMYRLMALRDRYDPFREYCESNHEYERLAFLKWRFQRGQFATEAN